MAQFKMQNNEVSVCIDEHASEIHSFKDLATNIEYMWQGDPKFWKGRNPTLFPMVGSTWDKKLHINGKEYVTGNHGFTRNSDFTCIEHDDTHIVMELKDSEETRNQYPFAFTLDITYTLEGRTLTIHYEITNDNDVTMPFNFGLHPAFNWPICSEDEPTSYNIKFNQAEDIPSLDLNATMEMPLNRDALKKTVIITNPKSTESTLTDGKHSVTVGYHNYKWLAFWSPEAPFVCIEPWYGHADFEEVKVPFEQREGTLFLEAHQKWTTDYTIRIQ